jgi:7-cyano-7-deazaguanine reductase
VNDPKTPQLDDVSSLNQLGSQQTVYEFEAPNVSHLESFPNKYPDRDYLVTLGFPEFTSLCPKTSQPDFANVVITYVPDKLCVETKSLKLYFFRYRNFGAFMESIVNKICEDLVVLLDPKKIEVTGEFNARGGVTLVATAKRDKRREEAEKACRDAVEALKAAMAADHAPDVSGIGPGGSGEDDDAHGMHGINRNG